MSWEDEDNTRGFLKKRLGWRLSRRRVWVALACVVCVFCVAKHCWDCQAKPNNKARETVRAANPLAPDAPDMTQFASVGEWLQSLKMGRYAEGFERGGITTMDAVVQLTVKELTALGVTLVGHQKKIMNSVQAMRAQISANLSEGFLV